MKEFCVTLLTGVLYKHFGCKWSKTFKLEMLFCSWDILQKLTVSVKVNTVSKAQKSYLILCNIMKLMGLYKRGFTNLGWSKYIGKEKQSLSLEVWCETCTNQIFFYLYQMCIFRCELLENSQKRGMMELSIIDNMLVETCYILQKEFRC